MSDVAAPASAPAPYSKQITLIIVVVLIVIALAIGIWVYFQGKKKGKEQTNLNLSSPLDSTGNAPSASDAEIRQLAQQIHDDMDGLNLTGHDETIWNNALALNDNDLIKLNNSFNSEYQLESEESFVSWVSNESGDYAQTMIQRLKKLNLS